MIQLLASIIIPALALLGIAREVHIHHVFDSRGVPSLVKQLEVTNEMEQGNGN